MGIRDKPIAPASPWQNGFAERLIGSIRRQCLDHIIVLGEVHLRRILKSYGSHTPFTQQGRAVAANRTFRWSHFAYAISWRTSSSVCASLISDRHRDSGHTRKAHKPRPSGSESCRNGDVPALTLSVPLTDVILTPTAPYATAVSRRAFAKYWLRATVHPAGIGLPPGEWQHTCFSGDEPKRS